MRAYLMLVGLLSICSCSFGQECKRDLVRDVDFPGMDITYVYAADAEHCQRLCTQHSGCLFFTFIRHDWTTDNRHFYCYLKTSSSGQPQTRNLVGVTSGYSLKSCCPEQLPEPCLSQVYQDVDFPGADYRFLFTADYEECQRLCTQDPFCQFFTFLNDAYSNENIRNKCHLKFSFTIPITPIVEAKAGVTSGFSDKLRKNAKMQRFLPVCKSLLLSNTDIPGNDFVKLATGTPQQCQALCSAHPLCTYFSFESATFNCYLKKNVGQMVKRPKDGTISGIPTRVCQQDDWATVALKGVDFRGSDIRYVLRDDPDTCQKTCNEDANCQFYTYVDNKFYNSEYWRRCYLKSVISIPAPPKVTKLENAVSGFTLKNCQ